MNAGEEQVGLLRRPMVQVHNPPKVPESSPQLVWNFGINDELPKQYYPDWLPNIKFARRLQSKFTNVNRSLAKEKERVQKRLKGRAASENYARNKNFPQQTDRFLEKRQPLTSIRISELRRTKSRREANLKQLARKKLALTV